MRSIPTPHVQAGQQQPDCFDMTCPGCVIAVLEPERETNGDKEEANTPLKSGGGNA